MNNSPLSFGTTWMFFLQFVPPPLLYSLCGRSMEANEHGSRWRGDPARSHYGVIKGEFNHVKPWQAPLVTAWSQHSRATHRQTYSQKTHVETHTGADTVAGCGCRAQQDWNVTYCYSGHLATIEDDRQLAPQCLRADLCRSLGATGCRGILLGSFNYLGIRSLVQLIN